MKHFTWHVLLAMSMAAASEPILTISKPSADSIIAVLKLNELDITHGSSSTDLFAKKLQTLTPMNVSGFPDLPVARISLSGRAESWQATITHVVYDTISNITIEPAKEPVPATGIVPESLPRSQRGDVYSKDTW